MVSLGIFRAPSSTQPLSPDFLMFIPVNAFQIFARRSIIAGTLLEWIRLVFSFLATAKVFFKAIQFLCRENFELLNNF
jgi:hypothetical protein